MSDLDRWIADSDWMTDVERWIVAPPEAKQPDPLTYKSTADRWIAGWRPALLIAIAIASVLAVAPYTGPVPKPHFGDSSLRWVPIRDTQVWP